MRLDIVGGYGLLPLRNETLKLNFGGSRCLTHGLHFTAWPLPKETCFMHFFASNSRFLRLGQAPSSHLCQQPLFCQPPSSQCSVHGSRASESLVHQNCATSAICNCDYYCTPQKLSQFGDKALQGGVCLTTSTWSPPETALSFRSCVECTA